MRRIFLCIVLLLALAVWPTFAGAQSLTWNSDQLIDDNTGSGYEPQVAVSGSNVVAVWKQADGPSNSRIYSNCSTDSGATWSPAQPIENNTGYDDPDHQVSFSGDIACAVWRQYDVSGWRIYSTRSTNGGATWLGNQPISDNADGAGDPQVAISGNNVVAVWQQYDGVSNYRIYSTRSADGGATWLGAQLIENNTGYDGGYPQVAVSGSNVVAVWYQWYGSNLRIYSNYSTDGGATWLGDQLIENNTGNGGDPQVVISGSNVVAVWYHHDGSGWRIYSNYSTNNGATWSSAQLIDDNAGYGGRYPQVVISGSNVVAVWYQDNGSNSRIYSNYSTNNGATWLGDQLIEDNTGSGYEPQVAVSGSNVVAVWQQYDGPSNSRIYSNYSTNSGATWSSAQLIEDNATYYGSDPQVAVSGSNVVAVWQQYDGNNNRIYSNYAAFSEDVGALSTDPESPINFGVVPLGSSQEVEVKVKNTGGEYSVTIGTLNTPSNPFSIVTDNLSGQTLWPGEERTLTLKFEPISKGAFPETIDIPSAGGETLATIELLGIGMKVEPATITLISPNGGEKWGLGTTKTIVWQTVGVAGEVKIELFKGALLAATISAGTPVKDGSFSWTPSGLTAGTDYKVKITSLNSDTPATITSKATFTILAGSLTVISPNGGEEWVTGTSQNVTWSFTGTTGTNVKIDISRNGGSSWTTIIASTLNNGSYTWPAVTGPATNQTLIKVTGIGTAYSTITDTSDNAFSIVAPSITVVTPNGGESWIAGTQQTIRWSSLKVTENIKIELLNGTVASTIIGAASISPLPGFYTWNIPAGQTPGTNYKIRITSPPTSPLVTDSSNAVFKISAPTITILTPNGKESWLTGSTQTIYWKSSDGIGGNVKIELIKGTTLFAAGTLGLPASTANTGSYDWTIPGGLVFGKDYKIKITSLTTATITDSSNASFTISPDYITVLNPNNGEAYQTGDTLNIKWSSTGTATAVKIELLKGTAVNRVIAASTTNNGAYDWPIPTTPPQAAGKDYKIRITGIGTAYSGITDSSNTAFSIMPGWIGNIYFDSYSNWFAAGTTQTISWDYGGKPGPGANVKLELLKSGKVVTPVISTSRPILDGGYTWNIPAGLLEGDNYQIRITSTTIPLVTCTSHDFGIYTPGIWVTEPHPGEPYGAGYQLYIEWGHEDGAGPNVKIELLKGGKLNRTIAASVSIESAGYEWLVPTTQIPGKDYQVKVTSTTAAACTDTSDLFIIAKPPTVTTVSAIDLTPDSATLTGTINPNGLDTEYYIYFFEYWINPLDKQETDYDVAGDGLTSVPVSASITGLIENTTYNYRIVTSISFVPDAAPWYGATKTFKTPLSASITVTAPNGGENWLAGTTQHITWNSTGLADTTKVKIEISRNNGSAWTVITPTPGTANDGSYDWTSVTVPVSTQALVRVTSLTTPAATDKSNAVFTIYTVNDLWKAKMLIKDLRDTILSLYDYKTGTIPDAFQTPIMDFADDLNDNILPALTDFSDRMAWIVDSAGNGNKVFIDAIGFNTGAGGYKDWNPDYDGPYGLRNVDSPENAQVTDGYFATLRSAGSWWITAPVGANNIQFQIGYLPPPDSGYAGVYKVYGGNKIPEYSDGGGWSSDLTDHPENHGFTYLGESRTDKTFNGTFLYYVIKTDAIGNVVRTFNKDIGVKSYTMTIQAKSSSTNDLSISEADFKVTDDATSATIDSGSLTLNSDASGNITSVLLNATMYMGGGYGNLATNLTCTGKLTSGAYTEITCTGFMKSDLLNLDFSEAGRKLYVKLIPDSAHPGSMYPTNLILAGLIKVTNPEKDGFQFNGSITAAAVVNPYAGLMPRSFILDGTTQQITAGAPVGIMFKGNITGALTNAATLNPDVSFNATNFPKGSVTFTGTAAAPDRPVLNTVLGAAMSVFNSVTVTASYKRTNPDGTLVSLAGSASCDLFSGNLTGTLTNQDGLKLNIAPVEDNIGTITTSDGKKLANIYLMSGTPMVKYLDGYIESIF